MPDYICRTCHRILETRSCPKCGSDAISTEWSGYVLIIDAEKSEIAKRLNITAPGKYALKVR